MGTVGITGEAEATLALVRQIYIEGIIPMLDWRNL